MLPGLISGVGQGGLSGIQFVGGAVASKVGAAAGNSTIALNSGLTGGIASAAASGDFVLAAFATGATSNKTLAITDGASNYTLVGSEFYENGSTDLNLRIAYKFITSDTDTTFGPTQDVQDAGAMSVLVFRNVNATTPLDATPTTASSTGAGLLPSPPAITPVTPGAFVAIIGAVAGGGAALAEPFGSFWEYFASIYQSDTFSVSLGVGYEGGWTSGSYDPENFAVTGTGNAVAAMTIALRPA
jgi:hypothetical protein